MKIAIDKTLFQNRRWWIMTMIMTHHNNKISFLFVSIERGNDTTLYCNVPLILTDRKLNPYTDILNIVYTDIDE